jgi:hypothetical protein
LGWCAEVIEAHRLAEVTASDGEMYRDFAGRSPTTQRRTLMSLGTILIIILVVILLGGGGGYYYGGGYPHAFGGGLGLVLVVLLILWAMGVFRGVG